MLRISTVVLLSCAIGGCADNSESEDIEQAVEDAFGDGDSVVRVEGTVVDWVTGQPIAGAEVEIDDAWREPAFPVDRDGAKVVLTTDADGRFGPVDVAVFNTGLNPLILFRVVGSGRAPTASDLTVLCGLADPPLRCTDIDHRIPAPDVALVDGWRQQWLADGQTLADTLGIVALQFRERMAAEDVEGVPSPGVTPEYFQIIGSTSLTPGDNLRFLESDRTTLSSADQAVTTESGVALIMSTLDTRDVVGSVPDSEVEWLPLGVLFAEGWVFVERHIL